MLAMMQVVLMELGVLVVVELVVVLVVLALVVTLVVSPLDCCDSALQALLGGLPVNGA